MLHILANTCIFLMISNTGPVLMCLFAMYMSLVKIMFRSFVPCFKLFFIIEFWEFFILNTGPLSDNMICIYFRPLCGFHSVNNVLQMVESSNFDEVLFNHFCLSCIMLLCSKKSLSQGHKIFSLFSSWSVRVSGFNFRSMIHFHLIFVYGTRYGYPVFPAAFVEKAVLFPLNCCCTFEENQLSHMYRSISGLSILFH